MTPLLGNLWSILTSQCRDAGTMHEKITDTPRKAFHSGHWICCLCLKTFFHAQEFPQRSPYLDWCVRPALRHSFFEQTTGPVSGQYDRSVKLA